MLRIQNGGGRVPPTEIGPEKFQQHMYIVMQKNYRKAELKNEAIAGHLRLVLASGADVDILMHACDQHKLANQIFIYGLVRFLHVRFLFSFFKAFR